MPSSRRSRLPPSTILQLEEGQAVGLADVVDLHDVGVLQPGDGLRLGQEAGGRLGRGMGTAQDHLQGAGAVQADLPGAVDDAHAAAAQLAQDLVAGDGRDGPLSRSRRIGWQPDKQGSIGSGSVKILVREDSSSRTPDRPGKESRKSGRIERLFAGRCR